MGEVIGEVKIDFVDESGNVLFSENAVMKKEDWRFWVVSNRDDKQT
jgi:hypothetical protein